ncbi:MAG: sigma-54 dependent transcriptional regulator [Myxococcota bacterium]
MVAHVLIVDDERSMREVLQILLEGEGYDVTAAGDVQHAILAGTETPPDLVFTDLRLPDGSGLDVLRWMNDNHPDAQVIVLTAFATTENAVEAMRMGAYDYQIKPVKVDEIRALAQKALEKVSLLRDNRQLKAQLKGKYGLARLVGTSQAMMNVVSLIEKVAPTRTNVLIEGESGTGKELVARAVHEGSPRFKESFVAVNCGAIPETLIEAELFGHGAGAYTGAGKARRGLFEAAHGGTLLLDEIGELPPPMQVKLLRVLQERKVRRVGEELERPIDVRIIAATNRDLEDLVKTEAFREDLFYRLNVVRIRVPPLRERTDDIPDLARVFLQRFANDSGKEIVGFSEEAMRALTHYAFPGNVREIENCMERAVALASGSTVELSDLPDAMRQTSHGSIDDPLGFPEGGIALEERLEEIERNLMRRALERANGVKTHAAELLGLSFRSFRYRLQKLKMGADYTKE